MHVVQIQAPRARASAIEAGLALLGGACTSWDDVDREYVVFEEYFEAAQEAADRANALRDAIRDVCRVDVVEVLDRDWCESWKESFKTTRVSERVVVKPSWETFKARCDDCVITIDPGMSFGTGLHFTTRSCLRFLDHLATRDGLGSVCDLGCGSGILSIASVMLGARHVTALDHDAEAVRAAGENAKANGVGAAVEVSRGDLAVWRPARRYETVIANILSSVLREHSATIASCVAPGGRLILAGTTRDDFDDTVSRYNACDLRVTDVVQDDAWRSGILVRS